jgi:putative ABC transport system permease protein
LFGVLPAWRSSRLDPALALRDNARGSTSGRGRGRLHAALVVGETALGLTLLVGAGLLIRSFDRVLSVDPGFNPNHLLTFRVAMPGKRFAGDKEDKLVQFAQQLQVRLAAVPGAQQATYAFPMPLSSGDMSITFSIDGRPTAEGDQPSARASIVPANFFSAMQMSLRRGRFFSSSEDQPNGTPVIIVNQAFADRYFPGEDAVGKRIASDLSSDEKTGKATMREIVGVVGDVHRQSLTETSQPEYYLPYAQAPVGPPVYALRVAGDPANYDRTVRALVADIDPSLPVYAVRTNLLTRSTAQQRFQTLLLSGFAVLALVLAAIGLYAVISTMVAERTMELGLRMALGAQRGDVLSLVLQRGLVLSGSGLALGLAASFALTRYLATLLFKTPAIDPATFGVMTLVLFLVSIASCLVPAWRASRLDPNETVRQQ